MKITQLNWTEDQGWQAAATDRACDADLALVFGATGGLRRRDVLDDLAGRFPRARLFGCSTAGEISGTRVIDDSVVATAIELESSSFSIEEVEVTGAADSLRAGEQLAAAFDPHGLAHVFVLSDGLHINGSELVKGLTGRLPRNVIVTGGLSADGARFGETLVLGNGEPRPGLVAALGLYGERLRIGYASLGGWDPFGPERLITRSRGNVLYELDGRSALELYRKYLGEHARGLPATGLLFPLSLRTAEGESGVVRTILAVDEQNHSMTFAGDVPEGAYVRLMKANFDRLIDGAVGAARACHEAIGGAPADLGLLISCVGRKLVLRQRIEEEVEGVRDVLGDGTVLAGFYSYGEISPFTPGARCELHNQTMTITTLSER